MAGPECCSNPPTLDPSSGSGHVRKFAGLNSYLSGSPYSNRAILFVSDIFGISSILFCKHANKVAAAGYYVVVPDFFNGDPFDFDNVNRPLPIWIKDHGVDKGFEAATPLIN
ncbi:endo-1,3;1,4-beta-D-glucanase-like [Gastrolobium bilobum]|uniref:endo-1,3;1,4-beta-D-glucanase-like n=1 Tax=Gastrolobium bilobum TaxID=150636 RepID=UPI002AB059AD|nr:endo-1,3;1,4-beta-D-glucanase-like [Gastrolobium bilobum]